MTVCIGSVRWPPELYEIIKREARKDNVSLNSFVVRAMSEYLGFSPDANH